MKIKLMQQTASTAADSLAKTKNISSAQSKNTFNRRNDIHPPRSIKQLYNLNLDLDSPRMKAAMDNLGIDSAELQIK